MSASTEAAASQLAGGYHADIWLEITLPPMMKVWQGVGGHSNFFFSEQDAREATGAWEGSEPFKFAETLWRFAQVQPNADLGFRQGIRELVVDIRTKAAIGVCLSNPGLGSGTVIQYYIPNWERTLMTTGREFKFSAKSF
jgi:hypothetical protein